MKRSIGKLMGFVIVLSALLTLPAHADWYGFVTFELGDARQYVEGSFVVQAEINGKNYSTEKYPVSHFVTEANWSVNPNKQALWTDKTLTKWTYTLSPYEQLNGLPSDLDLLTVQSAKARLVMTNNAGKIFEFPWIAFKWGQEPEGWRTTILYKMTDKNTASYGEWFEGRSSYVKLVGQWEPSSPNDLQYLNMWDGLQPPASAPKAPAQNPIRVFVNGQSLILDAEPQIVNGTTMVPMRAILEALGQQVTYNSMKKEIQTFKNGVCTLRLTVGNARLEIIPDSEIRHEATMPVAPMISSGRTLVPLRALAEALNFKVQWDGTTREIRIAE